ncbi:MAG: heavy metal sensor histidine kinase [Acidobacteria bacterium]|nr:heavy metal sensor histidine kinase [Acidobacteriota bacterium]
MRRAREPISITTRIVVVSTVASIALLGGFGIFLDGLFSAYQRRQYRAALSARIQFVHAEIASADDPVTGDTEEEEITEIREVLENQNGIERADRFYVQILDARGRSLMQVAGIERILRTGVAFPPPVADVRTIEIRHVDLRDGSHVLITSTRLATSRGERVVKAVLDWSVEEEALEALRRSAAAALLLGATLSAFAASRIARRALLPVRQLARAADRIEASRLAEPLETSGTPRELRELAASLASMQRRLDESFARLSAFASDLAHELRTPLNNLMGEVSVTLSRPRSDDEYRDVLGSALEECRRLSRTIDSLLFLARADRGAVEPRATEFDVATEIASLVEYYQVFADERRVRLTLEGSARVVADRDLVRQAVGNLLANAAHYCREGGLAVTSVREESGFVVIEVRDDGPGIATGERAHLFDRFFRGGDARRAHPDGSGLGLSLVRSIARLHGGDAEIESVEGRGTVARIRIPGAAVTMGATSDD